jgi:hypothetical protein
LSITRRPSLLWILAKVKARLPPRLRAVSLRRRARQAVVVSAVAYAALHIGLVISAEYSPYLRDPVFADKERKLTRLERELPPGTPLVLFLGTSRTANGFAAGEAQTVAAECLGRPVGVFNVGVPASGPVTHLEYLRRFLAGGRRPALLLVEVFPPSLAEFPDGSLEDRFVQGTSFTWDEIDWADQYGFPTERLLEQRRRVLVAPWYALRFQILGRITPTALPFNLRYDWSRGPDPNGWSPILQEDVTDEWRGAALRRAKAEHSKTLADMKLGTGRIGPVRALADLLATCRDARIPVLLVRMPEGPSFRAFYHPSVTAKLDSLLKEFADVYGCGIVAAREWMPEPAFADGHHLLRPGAREFSERLGREIIAPTLRGLGGELP